MARTGPSLNWDGGVTRSSQTGLLVTAVNDGGKADSGWQLTDGGIYIALVNGSSFVRVGFLTSPGSLVVEP